MPKRSASTSHLTHRPACGMVRVRLRRLHSRLAGHMTLLGALYYPERSCQRHELDDLSIYIWAPVA